MLIDTESIGRGGGRLLYALLFKGAQLEEKKLGYFFHVEG